MCCCGKDAELAQIYRSEMLKHLLLLVAWIFPTIANHHQAPEQSPFYSEATSQPSTPGHMGNGFQRYTIRKGESVRDQEQMSNPLNPVSYTAQ